MIYKNFTFLTSGVLDPPQSNEDLEKFDQFVEQHGVPMIWEKAIICPCANDVGIPNPHCPYCYGRGLTYLEPQESLALFTSMEGFPSFAEPGLWIFGVATVSTLSSIKLSTRDRIIITDFETTYIESYSKDGDTITVNFPIHEVEYLYYIDADGKLTAGDPEVDYTFEDRTITWLTPTIPAGGTVSIRYKSFLQYLVMTMLHEARGIKNSSGEVIKLPNQYLVRREDLLIEEKKGVIDNE
ncbi:MAG TPA: hypothetical protein PKI14_13290 [Fervidobacterium sp.]|nr:hypothetical protein [Fervidobacterium sp.]